MKCALLSFGAVVTGLVVAFGVAGVSRAEAAPSLTVSIAPLSLECGGGAAFVQARTSDGSPAGTVTFSTTIGVLNPPVVIDTVGIGVVTTTLSVPGLVEGTAVVTATNDAGLTASATATVTCTKDVCKDGGWETLTRSDRSAFKNQGDCIKYVKEQP